MTRTWYEDERDYQANLARWWLARALLPGAEPWEGAEAAYHVREAAHYDRLERCFRRHVRDHEQQPPVICAWCGRELRLGKGQLSHGICLPCAERLEAEATEGRSP